MSQIFITLSYCLHALATVVLIGHYLLLALVYIPALSDGGGAFLSEISKRSRLWVYTSLVIFFITGFYLMLVNPFYLGIGKFNNPWSILMLVKHLVVLAMIAAGFYYNAIVRVGPRVRTDGDTAQAIARFRRHANIMAVMGIVILLLTAISQAQ